MRVFFAVFDFRNDVFEYEVSLDDAAIGHRHLPKVLFDLVVSIVLLIPLGMVTLLLIMLNPVLNAGPLVFLQTRMGKDCRPFTAIKFRTMSPETATTRGAFDALETDRISRLGQFLRKTRIDELPQIINVLRGDMSLIGPRPDSFDHAIVYLREVPGYARRHQGLPGISGYAQTEVGYVDGPDGIRDKVDADLYYLRHATLQFDLWITWRTLCVVFGCKGS